MNRPPLCTGRPMLTRGVVTDLRPVALTPIIPADKRRDVDVTGDPNPVRIPSPYAQSCQAASQNVCTVQGKLRLPERLPSAHSFPLAASVRSPSDPARRAVERGARTPSIQKAPTCRIRQSKYMSRKEAFPNYPPEKPRRLRPHHKDGGPVRCRVSMGRIGSHRAARCKAETLIAPPALLRIRVKALTLGISLAFFAKRALFAWPHRAPALEFLCHMKCGVIVVRPGLFGEGDLSVRRLNTPSCHCNSTFDSECRLMCVCGLLAL